MKFRRDNSSERSKSLLFHFKIHMTWLEVRSERKSSHESCTRKVRKFTDRRNGTRGSTCGNKDDDQEKECCLIPSTSWAIWCVHCMTSPLLRLIFPSYLLFPPPLLLPFKFILIIIKMIKTMMMMWSDSCVCCSCLHSSLNPPSSNFIPCLSPGFLCQQRYSIINYMLLIQIIKKYHEEKQEGDEKNNKRKQLILSLSSCPD